MLSDPHLAHVEEGLSALDFLVVQDIFPTETTRLAHVILPAASSLEKDGTMTNTERRVQRLQPVLAPPGEARPDWWIILELARRLGEPWAYDSTAAIMDEIARATPSYGGISHERLSADGLCWPCPSVDHPGTPILHIDRFTRGRGKLHVVPPREPAEQPDDEYPLVLTTGRILYHYHTGTMTRRSEGLHWREPRAFAELHPSDAARAGVRDGGIVVIRGRRGTVRAQARVGEAVQPGLVFLSFHWREAAANALTQDFALDPYAKIPEYKICAVRIERPAATRA
jgi:predicted molibdopterin-dependent oxidoreductase YjgC